MSTGITGALLNAKSYPILTSGIVELSNPYAVQVTSVLKDVESSKESLLSTIKEEPSHVMPMSVYEGSLRV